MKLLFENWRQYLEEEGAMVVYRGVPEFVYKEFLKTGVLPLATDIIPKDREVMNHALRHGFNEEDMPDWAKEASAGINATKDKENAKGYGKVIAMKITGEDYIELPGGYVFIKDYDQVEII